MSENQPPEEVPNKDIPAEETAASGSRWEDTDAVPPMEAEEPAEGTTVYAASDAGTPVPTEPDVSAPKGRSRWASGKAALVGAGLGIALVAGAGGFAIGHATADGGDHGRFESERRGPGQFDGNRPMPPGEGDRGMDRGDHPDFGQQIDPRQDDSGPGDTDQDDPSQDDSSTQG